MRRGRCPGNSVRPRPEHFRAGVFACARPFWGPRGRSPHRVRAFLSHLRVIAPGAARAVETRPRTPVQPLTCWASAPLWCSRLTRPQYARHSPLFPVSKRRFRDLADAWVWRSQECCVGGTALRAFLTSASLPSFLLWGSPEQPAGHRLGPDPRWRPQFPN